jgi:hypothetical protein
MRWFKRWRWLLLVALAALPPAWYATAYPRGQLVARIDNLRGQRQVQWFGPPPSPTLKNAVRLLNERYGVGVRFLGCNVAPAHGWYVSGYNAASQRLLREEFGKDVIQECLAEAAVRDVSAGGDQHHRRQAGRGSQPRGAGPVHSQIGRRAGAAVHPALEKDVAHAAEAGYHSSTASPGLSTTASALVSFFTRAAHAAASCAITGQVL